MRALPLAAVLALATACVSNNSELQYAGSLEADTKGVVLFEEGDHGHAGMSGTTCGITSDGGVTDDVDVDESADESIVDGSSRDGDDTVLARTSSGFAIIQRVTDIAGFTTMSVTGSLNAPGAVYAGVLPEGFVSVSSCGVDFLAETGELVASQSLGDQGCTGMEPAIDLDRNAGVVYLSTADQALAVSKDGVTALPASGDLLSFAQADGAMLLADRGANEVRYVGLDGATRWSSQMVGPVIDVADMGVRGEVAVMVEIPTGGQLVLLDRVTGLTTRSFSLPDTADMVMADNGRNLALVVDRFVHFYDIADAAVVE